MTVAELKKMLSKMMTMSKTFDKNIVTMRFEDNHFLNIESLLFKIPMMVLNQQCFNCHVTTNRYAKQCKGICT